MAFRGDSETVKTEPGGYAPGAGSRGASATARGGFGVRRFLGLTGLVFAAAYAAVMALPHDPYIRYQSFSGTIFERLDWVYERLVFDETPIDVLVVGSSRSARGANAAMLEEALAKRGVAAHVANISEPAAGMDIRLTKIRLALDHHPEIKVIVLGVAEALPRDGHQAFSDLATPGEILTSPWIVNRNLPGNIARLPYRQMELAVATLVPEAFGYRAEFDPGAYLGPTPDHRLFNDPGWTAESEAAVTETQAHAEAMAAESKQRRREITPPILPESLGWVEFGVSRHYVQEIVDLAAERDVGVAFLFQPFYDGYDAPVDAAWLAERGPLWIADFMKSDPANYADAAHASQKGVDLITPWLAGEIAGALETRQ